MRVDTLGFLAPQAAPPEMDPTLPKFVEVMHVTAAAPLLKTYKEVMHGNGRLSGLLDFITIIESQPKLQIVRSAEDLANLKPGEETGIVLGLQETPYDITPSTLKSLHAEGVRVLTPVYQDPNHPLGSGYPDPTKPLTLAGKNFIYECARLGLIVDLSHLGHTTARDVMDFRASEDITSPIMASHGGIFEYFDGSLNHKNNLRNLPLDVLKRVAEVGGVVGMYALTFGLSETDDTTKPFINQTIRAVKELGPNAVTLGTDSIYTHREIEEWKATIEMMTKMVAASGELDPRFPDIATDLNTPGKIDIITWRLIAAGLTSYSASRVAGKNAYKFLQRSL